MVKLSRQTCRGHIKSNFLSSSQFPNVSPICRLPLFKGLVDGSIFLWVLTGLMLRLSPSQLTGCSFCPFPSLRILPLRFTFPSLNLIKDTCNQVSSLGHCSSHLWHFIVYTYYVPALQYQQCWDCWKFQMCWVYCRYIWSLWSNTALDFCESCMKPDFFCLKW